MNLAQVNREEVKAIAKNSLRISAVLFLVFLLFFYFLIRGRIDTHTQRIYGELSSIYNDGVRLTLVLDQDIPIELDLPLSDIIDMSQILPESIPFNATIPIKTTVRLSQGIKVPVDLPVVGTTIIDVPINAMIPIEENIVVNTEVKIDPDTFKVSDTTVSIDQTISVNMPIELLIPVKDVGLAKSLESGIALINILRLAFLLKGLDL